MANAPTIFIAPEAFGLGFDVTVRPVPTGDTLDREFPTYRAARGYAGGLRLVKGWPVVDHLEGLD